MRGIDLRKSLEQLEQDYWGEAEPDSSPITAECHRLRRVPLGELKAGDLLLLIRRGISLQRIVPLALALVEAEPLTEGRYYPGDLTVALLCSDRGFWERHPEYCRRLLAAGRRTLDEAVAAKKAVEESKYGIGNIDFTDLELLRSTYTRFCEQHHLA